jgi:predicted outer membrane repeat protein
VAARRKIVAKMKGENLLSAKENRKKENGGGISGETAAISAAVASSKRNEI